MKTNSLSYLGVRPWGRPRSRGDHTSDRRRPATQSRLCRVRRRLVLCQLPRPGHALVRRRARSATAVLREGRVLAVALARVGAGAAEASTRAAFRFRCMHEAAPPVRRTEPQGRSETERPPARLLSLLLLLLLKWRLWVPRLRQVLLPPPWLGSAGLHVTVTATATATVSSSRAKIRCGPASLSVSVSVSLSQSHSLPPPLSDSVCAGGTAAARPDSLRRWQQLTEDPRAVESRGMGC